ncbi:hypothetical protein FACS1894186_0810 [Alphaproteobacteria bacterium]|nr:hypothetical protein FACS1894186_0810 [Alphaproteobacteria bacterium]
MANTDEKAEEAPPRDREAPAEGGDGAEGTEGQPAPKKKLSRKMLAIIAGGAALIVAVIGGLLVFLLSGHGAPPPAQGAAEGSAAAGEHGAAPGAKSAGIGFMDLPPMLVNLARAGTGPQSYLKLQVSLELADLNDKIKIEAVLPRVVDSFQTHLRELRVEELSGSTGMYRLKEELMERINRAIAPAKVSDILFKEMLVQ